MTIYQIAPKLRKLLLRRASNHSGEVIATVAAIDRAFRGTGCDWHDLDNQIGQNDNVITASSLRAMADTLGDVRASTVGNAISSPTYGGCWRPACA